MSSIVEMEKNIEEWREAREQVISLGKGEVTIGNPSCSMEVMYAIRAVRGQDPTCDLSISENPKSTALMQDASGTPLPTSSVDEMPTTPEEWEEWYALNEKISSKSPIGLLVEKENRSGCGIRRNPTVL